MADVTVLRCWPSCVDALDWSEDGVLALASDDRVELLFPNTSSANSNQDSAQWQHVALQVPWFTNKDLPFKVPTALEAYSIGEEISTSAAIAIAWSPSGLAKHRRCALAVLTTNLALSIWSADGQPHEPSNWSRRLVVNGALANDFDNRVAEGKISTSFLSHSKKRSRCRIRAFAWAPRMVKLQRIGLVGSSLCYEPHLIAVATDDNHLAFLVIRSPTTPLGSSREWTAQTLDNCSVAPSPTSVVSNPKLFEEVVEQQVHVSSVAWSPWIHRGRQSFAVIAYSTNRNVCAKSISYACGKLEVGKEVIYWETALRSDGLMRWSPQVTAEDQLILAIFPWSGVVCLTVDALDASILATVSHDLDERWDEVSGIVWDMHQDSIPRLHVSSLSTTLHNPAATFDLSLDTLRAVASPSWRTQMSESSALFSMKNDLKGHIRINVWGLASPPLGDFIAVCSTSHPSDMIEYGPPNDRRVTVAINVLQDYEKMRSQFPLSHMTAEGVVFTVQKLVQNLVENSNDIPLFAAEMVDKLWKAHATPQFQDAFAALHDQDQTTNLRVHVEQLRMAIFLDPFILKDRYTILVNRACNKAVKDDLPRALISYQLSMKLITMPSMLLSNPFSKEVFLHHYKAKALIDAIAQTEMGDRQDFIGTTEWSMQNNQAKNTYSVPIAEPYETRYDICNFCSESMPFTDLRRATCVNGHTFPRCGLSLLAIQAPGITKYCSICDTPVLTDVFVAAQEGLLKNKPDPVVGESGRDNTGPIEASQSAASTTEIPSVGSGCRTHDQDPADLEKVRQTIDGVSMHGGLSITLARVLFLGCDTCIYCGGKYVG